MAVCRRNPLEYLLIPLSWIYGLVIIIRNFLFDRQFLEEKEFNIPIISVGNITVGGTGKTPHVEYLVNLLKSEFKVATLSRGYKRKSKGFFIAGNDSNPKQIGDEPCQIKNKFPEIIVAVDNNRVNGINKLMSIDKSIDVIILDDAYQHRYVKPGLSMLLVDYNRPVWDDYLLPFGRLREQASGKKRADIILVTNLPGNISKSEKDILNKNLRLRDSQNLFFTTVIQERLKPVYSIYPPPTIEIYEKKPAILLVCGIANPGNLKKFALNLSSNITEMYFPDHHNFNENDITTIQKAYSQMPEIDKIIITTEKDKTRLKYINSFPEIVKKNMFYLPIRISFLNKEEDKFNNLILDYIRNFRRNSMD